MVFHIRSEDDDYGINEIWELYPTLFSINLYHGGYFTSFPCRRYEHGHITLIDLLDTDKFDLQEMNMIRVELGYSDDVPHYFNYRDPTGDLDYGLHALIEHSDVQEFMNLLGPNNRVLDVYMEHGNSNLQSCKPSQSSVEPEDTNVDSFDPFLDMNIDEDNEDEDNDSDLGEETDSDFIVDEDNDIEEDDVDMRDFNFNVDAEDDTIHKDKDLDDADLGVIDNDNFESGSELDENLASIRRRKLKYIRRANANDNNFFIGQMFGTKEEVKKFIRKHTIETRRLLKIVKDAKERVRVVCAWDGGENLETPKNKETVGLKKESGSVEGGEKVNCATLEKTKNKDKHIGGRGKKRNPTQYFCPWVLLVSKDKESESWMVKTFNDHHKCLQSRSISACTSTFLAEQLMDQIEENPNIPVKAVQQFQRKFKVSVSKMQAFRARCKAQLQLHGDYTSQYGLLRDYFKELLRTNPGTTIKIDVEPCSLNSTTRQFKRVYICLGSLKEGFKAIGRILLGLDGAFMKGPYPGQMLSAVGMDNNNCIYPVCYAIVEAENINSWTWFLNCLGEDLELGTNSNFTFVSDRQKGILEAVSRLFPCAEHRFCLRHIYENMRIKFKGKTYKDHLFKIATCTTIVQFERGMDELKTMDTDAHLWLSKINPKHWSRAHFTGKAHSDVLLNNMCEVFNSKLVNGRDKPIITVLEYIREYPMRRIVNVLQVIDKTDGPLTPTASKLYEVIKKDASKYVVSWNGGDQYGVSGPGGDQCVVDTSQKICTCRRWELTGIPCKHAVATIWNIQANGQQVGIPESWVLPLYKLENWKEVYNFKIFSINGKSLWKKSTVPTTLIPPKHHKPVGKPRKKRKRSELEKEDGPIGGKLSRKNVTLTCSKCKNKGHNSRTCKGQPSETKTVKKDATGSTGQKNKKDQKPVGSTGQKPAAEKPAAQKPAAQKPAGKHAASKKSAGKQAVGKKAGSGKKTAGKQAV